MTQLLERIQLVRGAAGVFVVGGWPAETRFASATVALYLRPDTEDLVEFKVRNGRATYRVDAFEPEFGGTYRARLEYSELTDA